MPMIHLFHGLNLLLQVCEMKLEHAGAPLHLEHKVAYMNRKVDERHGGEQNGVAHAEPGPAAGAAPAANIAPGPAADGVAAMDTAGVAPRTPEGSDAEPQQQQQQQAEEAIGHAQANGAAEQNGDAQQGADQNPAELFVPGTILQFSLDEGNEEAKGGLNFRGIRPIFGGKDGGVKHCEYRTVSALSQLPRFTLLVYVIQCLLVSSEWHISVSLELNIIEGGA